jgi:hypothetical protein
MGVIGSSTTVLFASGGCTSDCDVARESCKLPSISAQITIARRRATIRAIRISPELGNCNNNLLNDILRELWSEREYSPQTLIPPSSPFLRHNSVLVGCDGLRTNKRPTAWMKPIAAIA